MKNYNAESVVWDLSDYYPSPDSPELEADIEKIVQLASSFNDTFSGKLKNPDADIWTTALNKSFEIEEFKEKIGYYIYLIFSADMEDKKANELYSRMDMVKGKIYEKTAFFSLAVKALSEEQVEVLLCDERLKKYRRFFELTRRFVPYTLTESEEIIITEKNITGADAWTKFYLETNSGIKYEVVKAGKKEFVNLATILKMRRSKERSERESSYYARMQGVEGSKKHLITAVNNVFNSNVIESRRRGFGSVIEQSFLSNDVDRKTIETMMNVVREKYSLARRWFKLKAGLMGVEKIDQVDLIAPCATTERLFSYDEAKDILIRAYTRFSPEFGDVLKDYFDSRIVDAENRAGKKTGAFCMGGAEHRKSRVLMSYCGNYDSLKTLAHEMGHALHNNYTARQVWCYASNPLVMAETASTFGEIMLAELMLEENTDPDFRIAILQGVVENFINTVFRQTMYVDAEMRLYNLIEKTGKISEEAGGEIWEAVNQELYGDSVSDAVPFFKLGWAVIPHFVFAKFYCFAYSFGRIVTDALYNKFSQNTDEGAEKLIKILSAGETFSPAEILGTVGFDIRSQGFWQDAFTPFEKYVTMLEKEALSANS